MHVSRRVCLVLLLSAFTFAACKQQQQAVVGIAQSAVNAEHKAQAKASLLDQQRAALENIPVPTKSLYVDVHDAAAWANPFITVQSDMLDVRINLADANPSATGKDSMLRPAAARRQELQIRPADLAQAVVALPAGAWRYGRVIAVAEAPNAAAKDRPAIRRNVEAAIKQLNDLGVVVEEWPGR